MAKVARRVGGVTIHTGDCRAVLKTLPDASVHCVVTSPPYWRLRDYGCDGQIGLEATPEAFLAEMVAVFREVRRVLRDDGVCWANMGDGYAAGGMGAGSGKQLTNRGTSAGRHMDKPRRPAEGYKPKDLIGMPWRLVFALQADGWWLRSDVIWSKPNPMPESVTDRPTKAHEYVFLLTKRGTYFYDAEAVKEGVTGGAHARRKDGERPYPTDVHDNRPGTWKETYLPTSRNLRTVWTIPTHGFAEAHFATFPTALAERCIKAGTSERGCCPACGAPWERVIEKTGGTTGRSWHAHKNDRVTGQTVDGRCASNGWETNYRVETKGFRPTCACPPASPVPCTVLDPFGGAGTVGLVAERLQRRAVLIELNPAYAEMAERRLRDDAPLICAAAEAAPGAA